jgi:hypothetical protein
MTLLPTEFVIERAYGSFFQSGSARFGIRDDEFVLVVHLCAGHINGPVTIAFLRQRSVLRVPAIE